MTIWKFMKIEKRTLNTAEFGSKFKGQKVLKGSPSLRGIQNRKYNRVIREYSSAKSMYQNFDILINVLPDSISYKY